MPRHRLLWAPSDNSAICMEPVRAGARERAAFRSPHTHDQAALHSFPGTSRHNMVGRHEPPHHRSTRHAVRPADYIAPQALPLLSVTPAVPVSNAFAPPNTSELPDVAVNAMLCSFSAVPLLPLPVTEPVTCLL